MNQKLLTLLTTCIVVSLLSTPVAPVNLGFPLIGILTTSDDRFRDKERFFELSAFSFVPRSYTSWVEQTGAMPVLIPFDSELETLDLLLEKVQGLIIQSGKTPYLNSDGSPTFYQ
jgi:gamma-glutamyl-gamma-aminobutyrate hydrolase PuuD